MLKERMRDYVNVKIDDLGRYISGKAGEMLFAPFDYIADILGLRAVGDYDRFIEDSLARLEEDSIAYDPKIYGRIKNIETYRISPVDYIDRVAKGGEDEIGYLSGLIDVLLGNDEEAGVTVRKANKKLIRDYVKEKIKGGSEVLGVYTPLNALYGLILISDELLG